MVAPTGDRLSKDDWVLIVSGAPGIVRRAIAPGSEIVLGRGDDVDIDVQDSSISRRHARLRIGDPIHVEDLGSRNGTYVQGHRLAAGEVATLPVGAVAEIGSAFFVLYRGAIGADCRKPAAAQPGLLVVDETMRQVYGLLDTIAPSALSVLILGETGTGKELYARELHARSLRAGRSFVCLTARR